MEENKRALVIEEEKQFSIEEKWITNQISKETYDRWATTIQNNEIRIEALIEILNGNKDGMYDMVQSNLEKLTDLKYIYTKRDTLQKQELVRLGFDNSLYYEKSIYRTLSMRDELGYNELIMKEKGLLIYEKKRGIFANPPLSGPDGSAYAVTSPCL